MFTLYFGHNKLPGSVNDLEFFFINGSDFKNASSTNRAR